MRHIVSGLWATCGSSDFYGMHYIARAYIMGNGKSCVSNLSFFSVHVKLRVESGGVYVTWTEQLESLQTFNTMARDMSPCTTLTVSEVEPRVPLTSPRHF